MLVHRALDKTYYFLSPYHKFLYIASTLVDAVQLFGCDDIENRQHHQRQDG